MIMLLYVLIFQVILIKVVFLMISIGTNRISLDSMGLFTTDHIWERKNIVNELCELIYVIEGEISIAESEAYNLRKGNMLILKPSETVRKYYCPPKSVFYWIKFRADNPQILTNGSFFFMDVRHNYLFKEMLHHNYLHKDDPVLAELLLAQIIEQNKNCETENKTRKIVSDAYEMIRLNSSAKLKAGDIAKFYGYNVNHMSRLMKKEYGRGIKSLIDEFIIKKTKSYLVNSNYSIKEISALLKFDNENSFVKFYKYHEKETPTQYRNEFSKTRIKEPEIIN